MATADLDSLDVLLDEAFGPLSAGREDFAPVPSDAWFDALRAEADRMALAERSTPAQMAGTVVTRRLPQRNADRPAYGPCSASIAAAIPTTLDRGWGSSHGRRRALQAGRHFS